MVMNKGIVASIFSYVIWGFFPIYFHALSGVPAEQTTSHRVVWSFLFIMLVILIRKEFKSFIGSLTWRKIGIYFMAGALLAINWGTYVWAVGLGRVVETSLGYFINPIVSVLLGVIFLHEKLRRWQWVVVVLAFLGVAYITYSYHQLPWISLILAFSFALYGLIKKLAPLGSLHGLALETMMIFIPAFVILVVAQTNGSGAFGHTTPLINVLLWMTGIVTAIPLLLFSVGAKNVPLSTIGILQFIAPTIQFLLGIYLFHEVFTVSHLYGFIVIWLALIIFSVESFIFYRRMSGRDKANVLPGEIGEIV
jgi:chloramphenicol-sensitive protein RarD